MTKEERISKVLAEIQASIPKQLMDNVVTEKKRYAEFADLLEKALNDPDFPEAKKEHIRIIQKSTSLNSVEYIENPKIAKKIDEFVMREIRKAIKEGRLPKKSDIKNLKFIKELYEKTHNSKNKVQD